MASEREVERLVALSERLLFSIRLYFALSRRLTRIRLGLESGPAWEVETAMVESFALHTRGLADFFFTTSGSANPRRVHDAWALQFFDPPDRWAELVGDPGPWLRQVYVRKSKSADHVDRFGTLVAHLNHWDPPGSELARGWPVMQLAHNLGLADAKFVRHVDSEKVVPRFRNEALREVPVSARLDQSRLMPMLAWTRPALRQVPE